MDSLVKVRIDGDTLVTVAGSRSLQKVFTIGRNDCATYRIRRGHRHIAFDIIV